MKTIRLIELFAGYGSQAMALKRLKLPFEHHFVCEFDKYAIKSYNAVHGTNFAPSDIRDIHSSDLKITDRDNYTYLMTYSFPCTDLSIAGRMEGMSKGTGTRSGLLWEVERLLRECGDNLPQLLFMENVTQVHGEKNVKDFAEWISFLDGLGYKSKWADLNSKDYGIPQNRNRCFMISWLDDRNFSFPLPISLNKKMSDYLENEVSSKYYITQKFYAYVTRNTIKQKALGNGFLFSTTDGDSIAKVIRTTPGRRIDDNFIKDKKGIRRLTVKECLRLMGVAEEDIVKITGAVSATQAYKQAGNSIVVDVMVAIFDNLFNEKTERGQISLFDLKGEKYA